MIFVAGAASRLGRAVTLRLLEAGHAVRAGCRTPGKIADLTAAGAQAAAFDLERPAGFAEALGGAEAVFATAHGLTARRAGSIESVDVAGHLALIDAAAAAGVRRFVYTSAMGAAPDHPAPLWRAKAKVEARLIASGLAFTILRPSAFMDLHAHELIGRTVLAGRPAMILGRGRTRRNFVAVWDVAGVAVEALTTPRHEGAVLEIGGPDNLTDLEVAEAYARACGRPLRIRHIPPAVLRAMSALARPLHAGVGNLLAMPLLMEQSPGLTFAGPGAQPTSLEAFIAQRLQAGG